MSLITTIGGKKVVCSVLGAFALGTATPPVINHVKKVRTHKVVKKPSKPVVPNYIRDCPVITVPLNIPFVPITPSLLETPISASAPPTIVAKQISAVPEPTTWLSMIVGFFLVGYNVRKSNVKKPITSL